jgi:hypothetical protein
MTKKTITIHNVESGEIIEREMNAEELAWFEEVNAPYQPSEEEVEAAAKKTALLEKLGITADEAKLLLG